LINQKYVRSGEGTSKTYKSVQRGEAPPLGDPVINETEWPLSKYITSEA